MSSFHLTRPDEIHVICPKCGGRASARKPGQRRLSFNMVDLDRRGLDPNWIVACRECPYRARDVDYPDIGARYYRVEARGKELWAWNRDHFFMLLQYLEGRSVADNSYRLYKTFLRKEWIKGSNRRAFAKAIGQFLADEPRRAGRYRYRPVKSAPARFNVIRQAGGGAMRWPARKHRL